jgi:hypothetical protein
VAPPPLQAAADVAGGRLACSLALSIDAAEGPTTLACVPAGSIRAQQLAWDRPLRVPLPAAAARSLLHAVEDGRPLHAELARYLQPGAELFHDPAFAAYHGYGRLSPSELLVPGAVNAAAQLVLSTTFAAAQGAGRAAGSALPPYTPPRYAAGPHAVLASFWCLGTCPPRPARCLGGWAAHGCLPGTSSRVRHCPC